MVASSEYQLSGKESSAYSCWLSPPQIAAVWIEKLFLNKIEKKRMMMNMQLFRARNMYFDFLLELVVNWSSSELFETKIIPEMSLDFFTSFRWFRHPLPLAWLPTLSLPSSYKFQFCLIRLQEYRVNYANKHTSEGGEFIDFFHQDHIQTMDVF